MWSSAVEWGAHWYTTKTLESRGCYKFMQIHCRCSKILAPQQHCFCSQPFILPCFVFFSLMRNKDMNYSPQCIHSLDPLPAGQANLGRQYLRWTSAWRNRGSIHTGAMRKLRLVHSREGAASIPGRERKVRNNHGTLSTKHFCVSH